MSFVFHCMWLWAKATLGLAFICFAVAIIAVIIAFIVQLFDKNMKE